MALNVIWQAGPFIKDNAKSDSVHIHGKRSTVNYHFGTNCFHVLFLSRFNQGF